MAEQRRWLGAPLPPIPTSAVVALACAGRPVAVTGLPLFANPDEQIEQLAARAATLDGPALNRRIDVIVEPDAPPAAEIAASVRA